MGCGVSNHQARAEAATVPLRAPSPPREDASGSMHDKSVTASHNADDSSRELSREDALPTITVSGHPDASYNGRYSMETIINARPAYVNSSNRVLYHYHQTAGPGERSWSFDDRPLDGKQDFFHGGWTKPLPGGAIPLGTRTWSLSPTFGEKSITLTLMCEDAAAATIAVTGHPNEMYNGLYLERPGMCFGDPVYINNAGMVLYRYAEICEGAGAPSMSFDDRQQDGYNDWFHGGWLSLKPNETVQNIFGTNVWSLSPTKGQETVTLTLTFTPAKGKSRAVADIAARMLCDLPAAGARKPYGDTLYYQLCRDPAAGTVDEIAGSMPDKVATFWRNPGPSDRLPDAWKGVEDPVELRAAWFWTTDYCYRDVNRAVIEDERLHLWAPLIRSINYYIRLHPARACAVWRGSKMDMRTYGSFEEGCNYRFCMYAAYSLSRAKAEQFHATAMIKLNVPEHCLTAAFMEPVTYYKNEYELLLAPYTVGECVRKWKEDVGGHKDVPFLEFTIARDSDEFQIRPGAAGLQTDGAFDEGLAFLKPYKGDFTR